MRCVLAIVLGFACTACAAPPRAATPVPNRARELPSAEHPSPLERLQERILAGAVRERVHDLDVVDPYRALEADDSLTREWIALQNARTEAFLAPAHDAAAERRLAELLRIGFIDAVELGGERTLVSLREGDREQPAVYVLQGTGPGEQPLLDPLTQGERAALDYLYLSPQGRYLAHGISDNGDERSTLGVLDVASGAPLPDRIAHAKWANVSWLSDESGFYYTRYPHEGEEGYDADEPDTYYPRVFFHALGADPAGDPLVWQSGEATDFPSVAVGDADRYVTVVNFRGWTASDVHLFDRGKRAKTRVNVPDAAHPLVEVVSGLDKQTSGVVHRGKLYLTTNLDAPRRRIVSARPSRPGDRAAWKTVVAEGDGTIESWTLFGHWLAVHDIVDVRSRLRVFDLEGKAAPREIPLPTAGSVGALSAAARGSTLAFVFSSYFYPPTLFLYDAKSGELTRGYQVAHDLALDRYASSEATVASADGTPIHVTYVHPRELKRDGDNPVLLTGYGGFDVSLLPSFTRTALYWIERGGVYAVANLRGGGEGGEAWHRAGMLENKHRVFEDFEAVLAWLSDSGLSRPGRIAITGGSNGGLLMGAMVTRVPERFAAAASYVGLYDMLRYPLFPPAALWVPEYGDPNDPAAAHYLAAYSPYHQVKDATRYPAMLIETADHDTRVYWGHSTKFAARLQQAQAGDAPILFYMEQKVGHGSGTRLSDLVTKYARRQAFLEQALGMRGAR